MLTEMTINGLDIKIYNARLQNYSVSGTTVTNTTSSVGDLLKMPTLFSRTLGTRTLTVTLTFKPSRLGSDSRGTSVINKLTVAADNIAKFEAEIVGKVVEITLPDGFIYTSLVTTLPPATFDSSGEHDVTYTFTAIRHKSEETFKISANGNITSKATTAVPFNLKVVVPSAYDEITVCGIKVFNLSANDEIVINGVDGIITCNGINKFLETNFIEFPVLQPGRNVIECTAEDAEITVVYTPVYV